MQKLDNHQVHGRPAREGEFRVILNNEMSNKLVPVADHVMDLECNQYVSKLTKRETIAWRIYFFYNY